MIELSAALLELYSAAQHYDPGNFRTDLLKIVRKNIKYDAGMWGIGRLATDGFTVTPAMVQTLNLDPAFSVEWSQRNYRDPIIRSLPNHIGRAIRVEVAATYQAIPETVEAGRKYGIRSFAVIVTPLARTNDIQWLCLYQPSATLDASDEQLRWLTVLAPHIAEAARINQLLYLDSTAPNILLDATMGIANAATGKLICADEEFSKIFTEECRGFDGNSFPKKLQALIRAELAFIYFGKNINIEGRRDGQLVHLTVRRTNRSNLLSGRERQIASLYTKGKSCRDIAFELNISHATVRNHLASAYKVLQVHDKYALAKRIANHF